MGASQTKADILNQVLNETSIEVLNKNSTASSGYINQSNDLLIAGNTGGSVSGITQANSAVINVSALQSSVASGNLQSALTAALSSKVAQEGTALGYSASDSKVTNIIQNKVKAAITNENLMTIKNEIQQSNTMKILANTNTDTTMLVQKNEAEMIVKLVATMNSDIVSELQTSGTVATDLQQSVQSLIPSFAVGIIILVLVLLGGAYFFKDQALGILLVAKNNPMFTLGIVGVICAIIALMILV